MYSRPWKICSMPLYRRLEKNAQTPRNSGACASRRKELLYGKFRKQAGQMVAGQVDERRFRSKRQLVTSMGSLSIVRISAKAAVLAPASARSSSPGLCRGWRTAIRTCRACGTTVPSRRCNAPSNWERRSFSPPMRKRRPADTQRKPPAGSRRGGPRNGRRDTERRCPPRVGRRGRGSCRESRLQRVLVGPRQIGRFSISKRHVA